MSETIIDKLKEALLEASRYDRNDQTPPAALLWTDQQRQWGPLLPRLRGELPQLLTLDAYDPASRSGPAVWLRCVLAGTLPEVDLPAGSVPILYLPGVSRMELRAVEDCPWELQPIAELQYRGVFWSQRNRGDWTVAAFLSSKDDGLGLDLASDAETRRAAQTALTVLADRPVAEFRGRRLESGDFHALLAPDLVRDLLAWLNDPDACKASWQGPRWDSFRKRAIADYEFDPERDGIRVGIERLASLDGGWNAIWRRFCEAPHLWPAIPDRLRQLNAGGPGGLFEVRETRPQINSEEEESLRSQLRKLEKATPSDAARGVLALDAEHAVRRSWVWYGMGEAPLAGALEPLAELARAVRSPVAGNDLETMVHAFVTKGWKSDAAAMEALRSVEKSKDVETVQTIVRALYAPWLEATTRQFQECWMRAADPPRPAAPAQLEAGMCLLFSDGLRFDVAQALQEDLVARGFLVDLAPTWAALPTVTATGKPAVSPFAETLVGGSGAAEFCPSVSPGGQQLTSDRFRRALEERGLQILEPGHTGDPSGCAWTEQGAIDSLGHSEGGKLARRIPEEVRAIVDRIEALRDAGWKTIHVVTDHGWLWMPGGLPKADLPGFLVETRWSRCALVKPGVRPDVPLVRWHWDRAVWFAVAPGIACFTAGNEYAHGGLSLQECVTPRLVVRAAAQAARARIAEAKWGGLRCRVQVADADAGLTVDLRTRVGDASSSVVGSGKAVGADGQASVVVEDDRIAGTAIFIVLLDSRGSVLDKRQDTVGGER